jgi:hypothetical protein
VSWPRLSGPRLLVVAVLAFAAMVGFAVSPVDQTTYEYSFDAIDFGGSDAQRGDPVVAPLALARATPDALEVTLPCDEPGSSFASMDVWVWWSTPGAEHSPLQFLGLGEPLKMTVDSDRLLVEIGEREVLQLPIEDPAGCVAELAFSDGDLTVSAGGHDAAAAVGAVRVAEAVFAGPAATNSLSKVTVATREVGSSPSVIQLLLAGAALLLMVIAMREIIVRGGETGAEWSRSGFVSRIRDSLGGVDLAVFFVMMAWLFLIPTNIDDGWIAATQDSYRTHGDFSLVFDIGTANPMGYWINWVQHHWLGISPVALIARIPAVVVGLLTWFGIRSVGRSLGVSRRGASVWLMGAVFAVGFGAWNVTLRPEPVVAALLVASLALALRFRQGRRGWTIVAWIVVIALGLAAHPTGILVMAPLLVASGDLVRWARSSREAAWVGAAGLLLLGSLAALLLLVDSNLALLIERVRDASAHIGGQDSTFLDELVRYDRLDEAPYATVLRRLDIAFLLIGVGVFLTGKKRRGDARSLIGWSVVVSAGLLAIVPSKWPFHFGVLTGLVALLVTLELRGARSALEPDEPAIGKLGGVRQLAVLLGTGALVSYAWSISLPWTAFDLRTVEWWRGVDLSAVGTLLVVGGALGGILLARRRLLQPAGWSPSGVVVVAASMVAIVFTASTLALDAIRTDTWTFGRQNLQSLWGGEGCGLGDELMVPVPGSLRALVATQESSAIDADQAAIAVGHQGVGEFVAGGFSPSSLNHVRPLEVMEDMGSWVMRDDDAGDGNVGSFRSAWHRVEPETGLVALMVMGLLDEASGNEIAVQWGGSSGTGVADRGIESIGSEGYFTDWSLRLLTVPSGADRVRVLMRDATAGAGNAWVASSLPLTVSTASLADVVDAYGPDVLLTPSLAMYFPCVHVPHFAGSVVMSPGLMIQMWQTVWQRSFAAAALADRYFRVPVTIDPAPRETVIGAHLGDVDNFVFVSQEYLTGRSARASGEFVRLQGE